MLGLLERDAKPPGVIEVIFNSGEKAQEKIVPASIVTVDRDADLAALRPDAKKAPPAEMTLGLEVGDVAGLQLTQRLYVFGFPFGEGLGKEVTATETTVSSLRAEPNGVLSRIQVNGGINPGNGLLSCRCFGTPGRRCGFRYPWNANPIRCPRRPGPTSVLG